MECVILAQTDAGNWIEIVIILLVVGGSIFGAVSKKLIAAFSPKESEESGNEKGKVMRAPPHPAPPQRRGQPVHPVARPLQPTPSPQAEPPIVRSHPPRTAPRPKPAAAPPRPRRPQKPAPARAEARLGHLEVTVMEEEARFEAARERRMAHLKSRVLEGEERFEEAVEKRLSHLEPAPDEATAAAQACVRIPVIGRLSRQTLRHAVVLREILSPPLALRPPDDT